MPGQLSVIDEKGLALNALELWAQDKPIAEVQKYLRDNGADISGPAIYSWVANKLAKPQFREAYEIAVQAHQRRLRAMFIETVTHATNEMTRLLNEVTATLNGVTLTKDSAQAMEAVDRSLHRWLDKVAKVAKMTEFAPTIATQVNTQINVNDNTLRVLKILQDVSRWLPEDKRMELMARLGELSTGESKSDTIDATFTPHTDPTYPQP